MSSAQRNSSPRRMDGIEEMLRKFVPPHGTLQADTAKRFLEVIADNLLHIRNLTPTNVSAIFWQRPNLRWPVFSRAAREANLELRADSKGKGAWIMVPRDRESVAEMDAASRQGAGAAREAARQAAEQVEEVSAELRRAASAAQDEKGRVAEALRQVVPRVKTDANAPAEIADLKRALTNCDRTAKDGFSAADQLDGEARRLREGAATAETQPAQLAVVADEVGMTLVELASEGVAVDEAHAALGRTARLARGERRRCSGEVVRFDQVRCVYDLERDFVNTPALRAALRARQDPTAGPEENARALAACLEARGEIGEAEDASQKDAGKRVIPLVLRLTKSVGAEAEISPAARTLATYFVARALGAAAVRLPGVRVTPAADRDEVGPRDILNTLREALVFSRQMLAEVVKTRGEQNVAAPQETVEARLDEGQAEGDETAAVAAPVRRPARAR